MNEPEVSSPPDPSLDGSFDRLVSEVSARLEAGEAVDLDALAGAHPEHIGRLRKLWPTLRAMADLGRSFGSGEHSAEQPDGPSPAAEDLGDFHICREIGRGGMGVVYEARQKSLGRRVALKVLPFAAMLDSRQLARFQNEARAAATLDHPNIVGIYSVGCERGVHYYAMQYIDGRTLAQVIDELRAGRGSADAAGPVSDPAETPTEGLPGPASPGPLEVLGPSQRKSETPSLPSPDTDRQPQAAVSTKRPHQSTEFFRSVARLGIQAAEALDHAHQSGVVHRDIKPSNLMVDAQGHLWITDFGLAMTQADPAITATGDVLGTLRYMSPEQAQGDRRRMDHRTDIYSLGVTLYELVTLQPAFPGDDRETVFRRLSEDDPPPPRRLNPSIPRDLETIILKAMAKDLSRRYGTAQELADDLERFLAHEPIRARRPTLTDRAAKWSRRHRPMVWSVAAVAAIATVLVAGVTWIAYRRAVQVERDAGEYLAAAAAFLQSGDYAAADRELAEARGRLDAGRYGDGPLADEAARLSGELSAKDQFQKLRHRVHSEMYAVDRTVLDQAQEHCRTALELAGVFAGTPPQEPPVFQDLAPGSQAGFDEGVVEMLSVWAWLEIGRSEGKPPAERDACHRRAIEAFSKINDIRPVPAAYLWIAESQEVLGQKEAAAKSRAQADSLRPSAAMDYFLLGQYHMRHGHPDLSVTAYWQALAQQPDHYVSLLAAGVALGEVKEYKSAEAMLTGAIAMNPQTTLAYVKRAGSRAALGKVSAEADLQKARALDPDLARAFARRGQVFVYRSDPDKAIADCNEAIRLDPRRATAYSLRGHAWYAKGDLDRAIADCSEAIRLDPRCFQAYGNRSCAFLQKGEYDQAISDCSQMIRINPTECSVEPDTADFATAYANRSLAHVQKGDWNSALADIDQALELDKNNPTARQAAALHMVFSPDRRAWPPARAVEIGKNAVAIAPRDPESWRSLGVAQYRAGNHQGTIDALEKAGELRPGVTSVEGFFIAMALWNLGQKEEARRIYGEAAAGIEKTLSDRGASASMKPMIREAMLRFRGEAAELLGIPSKPPAGKEKPQAK